MTSRLPVLAPIVFGATLILSTCAPMTSGGWSGTAARAPVGSGVPGDLRITAHRGASGLAPENTLVAMQRAHAEGAGAAELDVQVTADGAVVLMHDASLRRTTGDDRDLADVTLADLRRLEAGRWFAEEFAGEPVPTLAEVLAWARGRLVLNIEIKVTGRSPEIAGKVVALITAAGAEDRCFVTSFDRATVEEVKRLAPGLRTGLIFAVTYPDDVFTAGWEILSCQHTGVNAAFVRQAHRADKQVHVWTVNDPERMKALLGLGVDSIITNRPDVLREVLGEEGENVEHAVGIRPPALSRF